ncbi:MAG TPA: two-component regulator propeller domain-containing protein, partial [Chitinophagales bacterium]|nr:two-component regulator propeller domain-containing protein [Chitinophagales bacterium]
MSFKRYGVSDGLSSNVAYAVAQDHLGFMWFGTNDGLNRFDGHTYVHYKNTADSSSLSNNTVRCIFRDGKNRLWIGTDGGLNLYNHLTNTFQRFRHHPASKNSLSSDYVSSICESRDGKIYVGTYDGGLNVVDAESKLITRLDATSAPRSVNALAADQTGVVWIGSSEGLFALNPNGQFQPFPHQPGNDNSPSGNDILSLYVDAQNTVWIGINGAWLNAYEPSSKTFTRLQIADAAKDGAYGLFSAFALVEDHQKQLWVGTFGGGLYAVDRYAKKFTAYRFNVGDPTSLGNNKVRSLFVNKGGSLWVGTERGVNSFSRSRVKFTTSRVDFSDPSLANNNVNALCEDRLGNVWIGVYGGLNLVNPNGDVIKTFGPADGLSSENVLSLVADGDVVWVGTESGVNAIDINTRRVIETLQSGNANSLSNNYIAALALGKDGALWIGTKGGGLNRYDHRTEAFTAYRKSQNGLSNDNVRCLFVDPAGAVWIGTDDGLNKFDPSTKAF